MHLTVRRVLAACAALAASAGLVWLFGYSPYLRFRTLRLVGNGRASEVALRHLADLPADTPLVALDLDRARAGVERHPWVRHAELGRVFPDTVVLRVEEREAVAVLDLDRPYLVDRDGTIFARAARADLDHPHLTGVPLDWDKAQPALAARVVREMMALLAAAPGHGGIDADAVSEVHFDTHAGYALVLDNGAEIRLGFRAPARLGELDRLAQNGVDLALPLRIDLGPDTLAVVTPL